MSKQRKMLVKEAFRRLDRTGDGVVTVEDLIICYKSDKHPEVGRRAETQTPTGR